MTAGGSDRIPRLVIALLALAVYGAGASRIVHREGAAYRAALQNEAELSPPTVAIADPPTPSTAPPIAPARKIDVPPPMADPVAVAAAVAPPSIPAPVAVAPRPTGRKTSSSSRAPKVAPKSGLVLDPVWNDPAVTKVWDVEHLGIEDENALGEALNGLILTLNTKSEVKESGDRVFKAAEPLRGKAARKEIDYTFTVLDSPEKNAFSIPGGYVYVTEGLLLSIGENEDYVLQFILAHEIAHVDRRHALECLLVPKLKEARKAVGTAEVLYRYIIPNAYFEGHDFEADRWALKCLGELGYGRYESLAYLRKLDRYARDQGFVAGRMAPELGEGRSLVDNHVRAHVSVSRRLAEATAILDGKAKPAPTR